MFLAASRRQQSVSHQKLEGERSLPQFEAGPPNHNDEGLADPSAANPFRFPDFTQESGFAYLADRNRAAESSPITQGSRPMPKGAAARRSNLRGVVCGALAPIPF